MKILQICNKPPFPPFDGGSIGINNVTLGLLNLGHQVKVLSVNTPKHFVRKVDLPEWYTSKTQIEFVEINTELSVFDAFINLFSNKSYNISRFFSKQFEQKIQEILENEMFDIVQIESIFLNAYLPIIRKFSKAKIVLRAPNVEFVIWERIAADEKNGLKKWYLHLLSQRLKKEEISCLNAFDAVYTVTQIDEEIFKNHGLIRPSTFIPTGLDATKSLEKSNVAEEFPSLFFIGALDWIPNQEGLYWFVDCVLPKVYEIFPEVKFYIAGRRPNEKIRRLHSEKVIVLGEVVNAQEYMESKGIMIVPLFSGSGMRVKIIEGMMLSKAIVSTSVGVEGILVENNKDILVADDYQMFANAILDLLGNFEKYNSLKVNAHQSAILNYSAEILDKKLDDFLKGLV